jgi:hypothetical protein
LFDFSPTVTLTKGVPIETVGKMLGHKNLRTTQLYAKVLDDKVTGDMQQLKQRLSKKEGKLKRFFLLEHVTFFFEGATSASRNCRIRVKEFGRLLGKRF